MKKEFNYLPFCLIVFLLVVGVLACFSSFTYVLSIVTTILIRKMRLLVIIGIIIFIVFLLEAIFDKQHFHSSFILLLSIFAFILYTAIIGIVAIW